MKNMESTVTLSLSRFKELESIEETLNKLKDEDLVMVYAYTNSSCPTYCIRKRDLAMVELVNFIREQERKIENLRSDTANMRYFIEQKKLMGEYSKS